ncbi:MAG: hypothetical protein QMC95_14530 [Desulfitobacteriaceae bacterium]|nr:hypothetical protein [Desulfitobacteriaceae bacterium]MDI6915410.1 hypothetical protein [Desulfitobacteriaceae bacterium]
MKKFNKKLTAIVGTAVVAVGLMALPAFAGTAQGQGNGWFGQMRSAMNQTFSPAQQQQFMSSPAMQSLHNSPAMQQAMQDGDVSTMQGLMNSDPALKAQIGQENIDKMNGFMGAAGSAGMMNQR